MWAGVVSWGSAVPFAQQHEPGQPAQLPGGFDAAAVGRGKELHVRQCGFCHGTNARGGASGPDLTRSAMVQEDEGGKQLGEFLKVGRPDRGMPPFPTLTEAQNADLAAFYHSEIFSAANRFFYKVGDVLVGEGKVVDVYEKESKGKTMTFLVTENVYSDEKTGEPVVSTRMNLIHRSG